MRYENNKKKDEVNKNLLEEELFKNRTVMIFGEITQELAREVSAKLLLLSSDSEEEIKVFINSPGGHVEAGDTIFDVIQFVEPRVRVIGTGWVASAGSLIYAAPPKERRFCLPNTRFMLHQPSGGVGGSTSDVKIEVEELLKMRHRLNAIFATQTGQPLEKIKSDSDRNFWMSAEEAIEYGLVGRVIRSLGELVSCRK